MMSSGSRKVLLTIHVVVSVGWIGAVFAYLAVVAGAMADHQRLRAAWSALDLMGRTVMVPLALAALATGVAIALKTPWGMFRHYWVVASLALTSVATAVLLGHMPTVSALADLAARPADPNGTAVLATALRGELLHAGGGLLVLLAIAALNVFKPRGQTAYGRRRAAVVTAPDSPAVGRARPSAVDGSRRWPVWVHAVWIHAAVLVLLLAVMHLTTGSVVAH